MGPLARVALGAEHTPVSSAIKLLVAEAWMNVFSSFSHITGKLSSESHICAALRANRAWEQWRVGAQCGPGNES